MCIIPTKGGCGDESTDGVVKVVIVTSAVDDIISNYYTCFMQ